MTGSCCSLSHEGPTTIRLQLRTSPPMKRCVTSSEQRVVGSVFVAALMSSVEGTKCKVLPHVFSPCCICESSLSEFQKRVYHTIAQIEKGQVTTYGDLAKALDSAPRAVGQALKRNPFNSETYIPRVPCHRVISKNCTLGGFSGKKDHHSEEIKKKLALLEAEGLEFQNFKLTESMRNRVLTWQKLKNCTK